MQINKQQNMCACPKSAAGHGFPTDMSLATCVFSGLRWEEIVSFVNIGGIIDHHCLNFLFIIKQFKHLVKMNLNIMMFIQ